MLPTCDTLPEQANLDGMHNYVDRIGISFASTLLADACPRSRSGPRSRCSAAGTFARTTIRAPRMTPSPRPVYFRGHPLAPDKILDEKTGGREVGFKIQALVGVGFLTPAPRSPRLKLGAAPKTLRAVDRGIWEARKRMNDEPTDYVQHLVASKQ